jgi:hypothetical protein
VQLTFHENDKQTVSGVSCILLEPDIDYFKDTAAHAFLEVLPSPCQADLPIQNRSTFSVGLRDDTRA